jgi:hydrogenase-4 component F
MNLSMPLAFFAGSVCIAGVMMLARRRILQVLLFVAYFSLLGALLVHEYAYLDVVEVEYLKADPLAVLFLGVLAIVGALAAYYGMAYARHRGDSDRQVATHNAALVLFLTMVVGVYISRHIGLVWAFLEASTLTSAVLIYYNRNKHSVEATWKYVFVCSIGIAIAFAGILFLSIASEAREVHDLSFEAIRMTAPSMNVGWLKFAFLFMVAGYSVKMGVAPLFNVDIDAKDGAPSHVSALLSSVLMIAGFVAIFRIYLALAGTSILPWMNSVMIIVGVMSVFFAAIYISKIKNIKRIFAYSSLEHAGIVLIAVGSGAWFAAVLHIILHAFAKSGLFFQYAHFYRLYQTKSVNSVGDYIKLHPAGAGVLILGLLAITAVPPMGTFITELFMFKALFGGPHAWVAIPVFLLLTVILWGLAKNVLNILYRPAPTVVHAPARFSTMETVPQYALLLAVVYLGFFAPPAFIQFVQSAVTIHP